jgi:hypothetical protein
LIILEVASVALFLICGQTMFSLMGTVTPSGGGEIPVVVDEQTQIATLTFKCTPENRGFIAASVNIGFGVTLKDGSYSTRTLQKFTSHPGPKRTLSLQSRCP